MPADYDKADAIKRAARFFSKVPFADLAVLSGSCASGKAREESDIDMVVGARSGRVWTARFFTLLFADASGIRHKKDGSKDKLCLSLFVSPGNFRMNDPENEYEKELYPCLMPAFGCDDDITLFAEENSGIVSGNFTDKKNFWVGSGKRFIARAIERVLMGRFGDRFENFIRRIQSQKIERYMKESLPFGTKSRVVLSAGRVETHFRVD